MEMLSYDKNTFKNSSKNDAIVATIGLIPHGQIYSIGV